MSSLSSSASSISSSPTTPGLMSRLHAGSESLRISEAGPALDQRMERRRSTISGPDRKRRLVNPEVVIGTRHGVTVMEAGSSSRVEMDSRPIQRLSAQIQSTSSQPGSSYDTAIDLSSSPPEPRYQRTTDQRRSWPRGGNHYMEYIRPQWQPDSEVNECPICQTPFSFWYRKHHCRKCGRVVCASCSPHRITIPRQYIVHPPDSALSPASALGYPRATQIIDMVGDASTQPSAALNPALGGGEEVRLCNPCVPDPNPEPPLGYSTVRAAGNAESGSSWVRGPCVIQQAQSRHRPYHSMSTPSRQHPYGTVTEAFTTRPGRRTVGSNDYPTITGFGSRYGPAFQERSMGYGSLPRFSNSPVASSRQPLQYPHAGASSSPPTAASFGRSRGTRDFYSRPPFQIDECDLCPICDSELPPIGVNGDEDARETHIRNCIENHGRPSALSGSPEAQPPLPVRMLAFTATEKDCIGQDGEEQECTICMEDYEVGQSLVRLECLCKFHKRCIVEWFERKKECPVHKTS